MDWNRFGRESEYVTGISSVIIARLWTRIGSSIGGGMSLTRCSGTRFETVSIRISHYDRALWFFPRYTSRCSPEKNKYSRD